MPELRILDVKQSLLGDNGRRAAALREQLHSENTFLLNLMSAPGSGKTTLLRRTSQALKGEIPMAVMEADIDSDVDARTMQEEGVEVVQLHTGGLCHLDAEMTAQGLTGLKREKPGLIVLENIGNLVCPAEFDTGASRNAMILSVPEGDDKPLKYPLMFTVCDVLLINKIDTLGVFDFDIEACTRRARRLNPKLEVIPVSAKTGEGIDRWADWLRRAIRDWQAEGEKARQG